MMKIIIKLYSLLLLFVCATIYAQPPCPTCPPGQGGVGGTTPGAPGTSPIDMYIVGLGIIAIAFLIYYGKKFMLQTK